MNTNLYRVVETPPAEACANLAVRGLLKAHVVELLEDSAAEEVEDHLLDCLHCGETYLKMHYVLGVAPGSIPARNTEGARVFKDNKVVSIADFRKYRR